MMRKNFSRTLVLVVPLLALTFGLGGCNKSLKQRAELLEEENIELRMRADQLANALDSAEQARALAESELRALNSENARLSDQLARRPEPMAATGFEGLQGVSTRVQHGEIVVDVAGDVLFDSGKVTLKSSAKQTLDQIASTIQSRYAGKLIRIAGHTDTDPIRKSSWKTNERLSSERALAVEEYLSNRGLSKDQMYAAGFGPSHPRGSKKDSRRVEIIILAQAPN